MSFNRFFAAATKITLSLGVCMLISCSPIASPISDDFDFDTDENINTLLNDYTDSSSVAGNKMTLLIDGPVSREAYRNLITDAADNIHLEMWDIDDDTEKAEDIGGEFADLLIQKAQAGVEVKVILDPVAMRGYSDIGIVNRMVEGGVDVRLFMPPLDKLLLDQLLYRTHKKFMVVDGKDGILGGMNFGYDYMGEGQWRDTNVQLSGPVIAEMQKMFMEDWALLGEALADETRYYPSLENTGEVTVRIIDQQPCQDDFDLNETVRMAIRCAKDHIDMEAPYFNPMDWLRDELYAAAERGVRIRVLTNSKESNDVASTVFLSMASNFQGMVDHDVEVYLWGWADHTIHSKALVVDDKFAFISSYNFNYRSAVWDTECAAAFTDSEPISQIQKMMDHDFSRDFVVPVTQEWIDSQGIFEELSWQTARPLRYIAKEVSPEE
jgi:cardiolipin synthase